MAESWLVLRCSACKICHGRKSIGHHCPHCGQRTSIETEVVDTAKDSNELRSKVILANTPFELRELLESKLSLDNSFFESDLSPFNALKLVKNSADEQGIIRRGVVQKKLIERGCNLEVDSLIEEIESQGLIIRIDSEMWQFLE
ncbi:MAG: hypothetical protein CL978_00440 [Euryarchaeota archaeon]|nr:hypothetical protein [Euryarchaeota archaeon]MBR96359.1 hypothetical protein [Euryarchaeota archaeon]|tara:strand:+ start:6272 stop:6703 length:432 start_codon:yes stop_codon:yes gene_type:complete